jgi:hypothetical protein
MRVVLFASTTNSSGYQVIASSDLRINATACLKLSLCFLRISLANCRHYLSGRNIRFGFLDNAVRYAGTVAHPSPARSVCWVDSFAVSGSNSYMYVKVTIATVALRGVP